MLKLQHFTRRATSASPARAMAETSVTGKRSFQRERAIARHRVCALVTCGALLSASLPALAAPSQADRAETLFKEGRAAYMKGDFKTAYQRQHDAWQLKQSFDIAANLGQAELQLRLYRDAAEHFRYALDHFPPSQPADKKARLQATFDKARVKVAAVKLHVIPDGAAVNVDGAAVGHAPLSAPIFLDAGEHQIQVALDGFTTQTKTVTAKAGGNDKLEVALEKEAAAPAPAAATTAPPTASSAPPPASPPPADTHHHGIEPRTVAIIAGAGLTAVALGVGIGFAVDAGSADSNASDLRAQSVNNVGPNGCATNPSASVCVSLRDANDHASRSRTISTVGFIGAGVFGVATLGAVLLWPKRPGRCPERGRARHTCHYGGVRARCGLPVSRSVQRGGRRPARAFLSGTGGDGEW